jgi:hypothetical protein
MQSQNVNAQAAASDAALILQPLLQENLQKAAEAAAWPAKIVSALVVDFDGSDLLIKYPDELASEIEDLEYGKPFGVPNSVFRPFMYDSESYIADVLVGRTLDLILDGEGIF